ncbi:MAG: hypothetical protein HY541_08085 [Deltaproteobacteria bacterium]|nr:hypothetical protein [Deltaproteobacteria bacterium]
MKEKAVSTMGAGKVPLGYPTIEKLIETEDFSKVNQTVSACYDKLEKMLKGKSGGLSRQKGVRAALKAYDLTIDLLRDLLKIKYDIIKQKQAEAGGSKKK